MNNGVSTGVSPGAVVELKYSYRTLKGVQLSNPDKTNQDSLLIKTQLNNKPNSSMFAVADGHGLNGHHVSQYIVKNLTKLIEIQKMKKEGKITYS